MGWGRPVKKPNLCFRVHHRGVDGPATTVHCEIKFENVKLKALQFPLFAFSKICKFARIRFDAASLQVTPQVKI